MLSSLGGSIAVSRSMPAILNDRISPYAWTSICDDIDKALEPLNDAMKRLVSTNIFFCGHSVDYAHFMPPSSFRVA